MHIEEKGIPQDISKYIYWLTRGVENRDISCEIAYAGSLYEGLGVEEDKRAAFNMFIRAATTHDGEGVDDRIVMAQMRIADAYDDGDGVARNSQEAMKWYLKAAEGGDKDAMKAVGMRYLKGNGTDICIEKALFWLSQVLSGEQLLTVFGYFDNKDEQTTVAPLKKSKPFSRHIKRFVLLALFVFLLWLLNHSMGDFFGTKLIPWISKTLQGDMPYSFSKLVEGLLKALGFAIKK